MFKVIKVDILGEKAVVHLSVDHLDFYAMPPADQLRLIEQFLELRTSLPVFVNVWKDCENEQTRITVQGPSNCFQNLLASGAKALPGQVESQVEGGTKAQ